MTTNDMQQRVDGLFWYAAGGGISRCGPYATQHEAWEAMRLIPELRRKFGSPYPPDARVWPEWSEKVDS